MSVSGFTYGQIIATPTVLLIVTWLTTSMRIYVKKAIVNSITADDWLMVIGLLIFTVSCGIGIRAGYVGFGKHMYTLQPDQISMSLELYALQEFIYIFNLTIVKISIAILLCRLTAHHAQRRIVIVVFVVFTLCSIVAFTLAILQCRPIQGVWDPTVNATCFNVEVTIIGVYTCGTVNAITDFIYASLPIWMIWRTSMDSRTKASVVVVLGLGMLSGCTAVARLGFFHSTYSSNDLTYILAPMTILDKVEVGIGIAAANLATFRPLLRILAHRSSRLMSYIGLCPSKEQEGPTTGAHDDTTGNRTFSDRKSALSRSLSITFSPLSTFAFSNFARRSSHIQAQPVPLGNIEKTVEVQTETSQCPIAIQAYNYVASWEDAWQRRFVADNVDWVNGAHVKLPPRRLSETVLPAYLRASEEVAGS